MNIYLSSTLLDNLSSMLVSPIILFYPNCAHFAGQKNKNVKTVVNKLNTIDNRFRFFDMERIAGEPNYVVKHVSRLLIELLDMFIQPAARVCLFVHV